MVYLGPSKGCETCKRRRKKCDETRPSCMKCTSSKRTCGGYEEETSSTIRWQHTQSPVPTAPESMARKCSLPVRASGSEEHGHDKDEKPKELSDDQVAHFALRAFFHDFCVPSVNRLLSHGYLHDLESMLRRSGLQSDLAKACKVVAFAGHAIKLHRPALGRKADLMYQELLGSLARAILQPMVSTRAELLATVMLLGLYETVMAKGLSTAGHGAHARGLAAILGVDPSPDHFLEGASGFIADHTPVSKEFLSDPGVFSAPSQQNLRTSLDTLLIRCGALWSDVKPLLSSVRMDPRSLDSLRRTVVHLDQELLQWASLQLQVIQPNTVGYVHHISSTTRCVPGSWPGRVDSYFDLYVANVWNTYRTTRLLLYALSQKLWSELDDHPFFSGQEHSVRLVQDFIASIPYHLSEDLPAFLNDAEDREFMEPGRPIGGLLLMHHLDIISNLPMVSQQMQTYLRDCLAWIGLRMGIGHASVLAKSQAKDIDQHLTDGLIIVWAGMLI